MLFNQRWGLLTRTGYDKSYLTRILEGYADIYMTRVSNFLYQTPFAYLRASRGSMPHDPPSVPSVESSTSASDSRADGGS